MNARTPTTINLRWIWFLLIAFFAALQPRPGSAQSSTPTSPKILVLTVHEGRSGESFTVPGGVNGTHYDASGLGAADNLARAFGGLGSNLVSGNPTVDYYYGALSIRPVQKDSSGAVVDKVATAYTPANSPNYSLTPTNLVRVLSSNGATGNGPTGNVTGGESVVYVPDNTKYLDPDNLASIFKPANGDRYDVIVVGSAYKKITDQAYLALTKVMQDPALKPNSILFFIDSCCDTGYSTAYNMARFKNMVLTPATAAMAGANPIDIDMAINYNGVRTMTLNSQANFNNPDPNPQVSSYAKGFQQLLPQMAGGDYRALINVPFNNILYRARNLSTPLDPIDGGRAFGIFLPAPQVFDGEGACTFAVVDVSPFGSTMYTSNTTGGRNIGQAFVNAALPGGACGGMASISAAPAISDVTLGAPTTTITLTIKNESPVPLPTDPAGSGTISGGRVEADLPAHLKFTGSNVISTTCTLDPTKPAPNNTDTHFQVTGISLPNQGTCTITLPVKWVDTADIGTNACIKSALNSTTLQITPGVPNQFSTNEGQTNTLATAKVSCSAPELQLTSTYVQPTSPILAGQVVSYDVTVTNLSETATATSAQLTGLVPAGATQTVTPKAAAVLKANPAACVSVTDCTLAPGETAEFTVQFNAPTSGSAALTWTPTIALANPAEEVTLTNNFVTHNAVLQTSTLIVNAQLNSSGSIPNYASSFAGQPMNFSVAGCTPASTTSGGAAPLGSALNTAGSSAPLSILTGTGTCTVTLANAPDATALPPGYLLSAVSVSPTATDAAGNQTISAVWTATPPGAVHISGTVQGAPSTFPASLVGQTVNYSLTCAPGAAIPASGKLTIGANGELTTADVMVPSGTSCSALTVDGIAQLPAAPQNYEWKSSTAASAGPAAFTVTLVMAAKQETASVSGSVVGAPATFPANLVGKTVSLSMSCTPDAAQPDSVTLTIDASGQLTTTTQPVVAATSTCAPKLAEATPTLPLPEGYEWSSSSVTPASGNGKFVVTLNMSKKAVAAEPTPVPTLGEWALYALSLLMLTAAAQQLRSRKPFRKQD